MRPLESVVQKLSENGYVVLHEFFTAGLAESLSEELEKVWSDAGFREAGIGVGDNWRIRKDIRSDWVRWLDADKDTTEAIQKYFRKIEIIRKACNRYGYLGLREYEAHLAVYPEGSHYERHLDQFVNSPQRAITCILYLNRNWNSSLGGDLVIYNEKEEEIERIQPEMGRFVLMESKRVLHEVTETRRFRKSITGWLKR